MPHKTSLICACFITLLCPLQAQLLEGLYCGKNNCYDVLGVTREATKSEIAKNYRKLAKLYHPDLHRSQEAKEVAAENFKALATAYEILKDDESRADYDYMLDNPDEYYAHYYRYYRRRVAPKVDVRIVVVVTITVISVIQYFSSWQRYDSAIKHFMNVPKYRNRALDIAKQENLLPNHKKSKGKSKNEQREELDQVIRKIIEDKMDIKGAYAKPTIWDILWVQLAIFPYTLLKYLVWYVMWIWNHNILKKPFSEEEKLYLIRKNLKMGQAQFDGIEDEDKQLYLELELWIKENFEEWRKEEEESLKRQMAESNRYKQYRRYMKQHGVGRMTFDDS